MIYLGGTVMKNNKWVLIFMIVISFISLYLFTGCQNIDIGVADKIVAPKNFDIPISGKWEVKKYVLSPNSKLLESDAENLIGKTAEFTKDLVSFGDETCNNPSYKIKNVIVNDYLLYEYKISDNLLGISNKNVEIVMVSNSKNSFYNFIKVNDNEIIVYIEGVFYYLNKSSSTSNDITELNNKGKGVQNVKSNKENTVCAGLLLGLSYEKKSTYKIPNAKEDEQMEGAYRTLWISSNNKNLNDIYETSDLFVPRKTGFWKVGVKREIKDEYVQDNLFAYPVESSMPNKKQFWNNGTGFISKSILSVANNYISTEWNGLGYFKTSNTLWRMDNLKVLSLDNIQEDNGFKISDVLGSNGKEALISSGINAFYSESKDRREKLQKVPKEDSFAAVRSEGHWILKGRLNNENSINNEATDFTIDSNLSTKLFVYDDLKFNWSTIREKVPNASDAVTSPNKEFTIILSPNKLFVYILNDNKLSDTPIKEVSLNDGEKVVMVEWAVGDKVDIWKSHVEGNGARVIN